MKQFIEEWFKAIKINSSTEINTDIFEHLREIKKSHQHLSIRG